MIRRLNSDTLVDKVVTVLVHFSVLTLLGLAYAGLTR